MSCDKETCVICNAVERKHVCYKRENPLNQDNSLIGYKY